MSRKLFTVKIEDKEVELAVEKPSNKHNREAHFVYSKSVKEALEKGLPSRQSLDGLLRKQNLWNDEKQAELEALEKSLEEGKKKLSRGGIKASQGREIALNMQLNRFKRNLLLSDRNSLDSTTAESVGEQDRFNYLVSACTVYSDTGNPFFKDVEDYLAQATEEVAQQSATNFAHVFYGIQEDFEKKLPENEFLIKYKFMDDKFNLVDKQGNRVDRKNRKINDKGQLIDKDGRPIDEQGNLLDDETSLPFLEDDETEIRV